MSYETVKVNFDDSLCHVQLHRPEANNAINERLIEELTQVVASCEASTTVLVLSGLPQVFCFGADFQEMRTVLRDGKAVSRDPQPLYDLWTKLAFGPFITISHVRGRANAGGVGFVAASDIVIADDAAQFSLSELLFGLFPAIVLPFLARRIGFQKAHYMTLMTQPVDCQQAHSWGLVDAHHADSEALLRRHLVRLRRLAKPAITEYKRYTANLSAIHAQKESALAANRQIFSDARNLEGIARYVETGLFPWEK